MKPTILCLSLFVLYALPSKAQWNTGINPNTPDNVSIGNPNTSAKLSINRIVGTTNVLGTCTFTGVPALRISNVLPLSPVCVSYANTRPNLVEFETLNLNGTITPLFNVTHFGNVGIGIQNPTFKFQLKGNAELRDNTNGNNFNFINDKADLLASTVLMNIQMEKAQKNNLFLMKVSSKTQNHGNEKFVILNDGEVGIGVVDPHEKLCVAGSIVVDEGAQNSGIFGDGESLLKFGGYWHGEAIGSTKKGKADEQHGLNFYTGYKSRMMIQNDGKVKIGEVSTPGNYGLYVEKGILTELELLPLSGRKS
jgi:hypothetical protein